MKTVKNLQADEGPAGPELRAYGCGPGHHTEVAPGQFRTVRVTKSAIIIHTSPAASVAIPIAELVALASKHHPGILIQGK